MRRHTLAVIAVLVLLAAASAMANSYNTPTIDGRVTTLEGDWERDEWPGNDPQDDCRTYPTQGDLRDIWVTWDETNLYFGVRTVNGPGNCGYTLYIDKDAQNGMTGATDFTSADFLPEEHHIQHDGRRRHVRCLESRWRVLRRFRHCDDLLVMDPDHRRAYAAVNPGAKHYEGAIPWDGLYGLGAGVVPAGSVLRFVTAVVGGDGTGAIDALPTSSSGIESNPATPVGATTNLDVYFEIPIDQNGDGVPDFNYPPGGSISGAVALADTNDQDSVVTVTAYQNGEEVFFGKTPAGGGDYVIRRLGDGAYDVTADAFSYLPVTMSGVVVADTSDTPGVDFLLTRVTGRIEGEVALTGGPAVDVTVGAYDQATGAMVGDGEVVVTGGTGPFSIGLVADGDWLVMVDGKGYVEAEAMATIAGGDTTDVGLLELPAVVATQYGFSDSLGNSVYGTGTTVSLPADTIYYYARAWLEPRDDDDSVAYWDVPAQTDVLLSATKLDPAYPAAGNIIFADTSEVPLPGSMLTNAMFDDGRAPFLVSGDAVEVVRVLAQKVNIQGVLDVGIDPPAPVRLALSTDATTIAAGDGRRAHHGAARGCERQRLAVVRHHRRHDGRRRRGQLQCRDARDRVERPVRSRLLGNRGRHDLRLRR